MGQETRRRPIGGGGFLFDALLGLFCGLLAALDLVAGAICGLLAIVFGGLNFYYAVFIPVWDDNCGDNGVWLSVKTWRDWWGNFIPFWYAWYPIC